MAQKKGMTCLLFSNVPEGTHYRAGSYSWVHTPTADGYIVEGYAVEYDPKRKEETDQAWSMDVPTEDNTVDEIKAWLDENDVEYSDENKAKLLELVDNA